MKLVLYSMLDFLLDKKKNKLITAGISDSQYCNKNFTVTNLEIVGNIIPMSNISDSSKRDRGSEF